MGHKKGNLVIGVGYSGDDEATVRELRQLSGESPRCRATTIAACIEASVATLGGGVDGSAGGSLGGGAGGGLSDGVCGGLRGHHGGGLVEELTIGC
ncbi:hypothetical protein AAG906_038798 [Vitis piasezkii]